MTAQPHNERNDRQTRQLELLLLIRLLVALACMGAQALSHGGGLLLWEDNAQLLLAFACTLSLVYLAVARQVRRPGGMAMMVMCLDLLLITGLLYMTGGNQSHYTYLYFALIVGASILVSERLSLLFASTATVCLSLMTTAAFLAQHYHTELPGIAPAAAGTFLPTEPNVSFAIGYLLAQSVALHLVALLSGNLAKRLGSLASLTDLMLTHMAGGLIVSDRTGKIQYFNRTARQMLGFDENDPLVRREVSDVFRRESDRVLKSMLLRAQQDECEIRYPHRQHGELFIQLKSRAMIDRRGHELGTMTLLSDQTDKHRMEEAERQAETLAGIEEMAAGIAHEIRNPLAAIRGSVQELARAEMLEDHHKALAEITIKESDRLDRIITDFLGFTRMRPIAPQPCNLAEALNDLVTLIGQHPLMLTGQVDLLKEYPSELPCTGDREHLKQLFFNLVLNALEAMGPEGGTIALSAERKSSADCRVPEIADRRRLGGGVLIAVSDSGPGISMRHADRVFTPFYTTKQNGTGMGLSIVQKIVTEHGGTVDIDRSLYGGACLRIWIPDRNPSGELAVHEERCIEPLPSK